MENSLKNWLSLKKSDVEKLLDHFLPPDCEPPSRIHEAMRYCVFAGGKRIRPILLIESCRACGGDTDSAAIPACAIECLHTYSLVHDDLPAMDDDDLRRGKPTCHKAYDEATAILAGDALLTFAFELLSNWPGQNPSQLTAVLAKAAGTKGMIGGQMLDIAEPPTLGRSERVRLIHRMKTAALLECACRMGAICAKAAEVKHRALSKYGTNLGLAFQIADDILDVTSTPEELGKATQKDLAAGKLTYPGVFGIGEAKNKARSLASAAGEAIVDFGNEADMLRALADYVVERKY